MRKSSGIFGDVDFSAAPGSARGRTRRDERWADRGFDYYAEVNFRRRKPDNGRRRRWNDSPEDVEWDQKVSLVAGDSDTERATP